jgi:DNA uptake protein and related DNA-binding proteins
MKRILQAYLSFNRTERMGIVALLVILVVLLVVRLSMQYWVKPVANSEQEKELATAWQKFKQDSKPGGDTVPSVTAISNSPTLKGTLFPFDPNTLDSAGFRKLGLREKTTSNLLKWRSKGKRFYKKEDLKPLYTLTDAEYQRLAPYIQINSQLQSRSYSFDDEYGPLPDKINLNTADSITLVRLPGIGPRLAHRILERRREKGAYTDVSQLREVYHFSDSTFNTLKRKLIIE